MDEQIVIDALKSITVINDELGGIQVNIAILQTQVATLLRWHWIIVSGVIGIIIIQAAQLLQMKKNGKK